MKYKSIWIIKHTFKYSSW